jgi:hypothetical protein
MAFRLAQSVLQSEHRDLVGRGVSDAQPLVRGVSELCSPAISHLDTEVIGVAAPHGNHSGAGDKMHGFER